MTDSDSAGSDTEGVASRYGLTVLAVVAAGVSTVATSFAIYATGREFLVSSLNRHLLEFLPGWFVSSVIRQFGDLALELSMVFSGAVLAVVFGLLAVGGYRLGVRLSPAQPHAVGFVAATVLVFVAAYPVVGSVVAVAVPAVVGGVVVAYFESQSPEVMATDSERRSVLRAVSAVAAFNVVAHGIGLVRRDQTQRAERELQERALRLEAEHMIASARDKELDVEDIKPLVTDIEDFYRVDINPSPPSVDTDTWELSITGAVEEPVGLDYEAIQDLPIEHQYKTIRCLSDDLEDDTLDTAVWTGTPMGEVLDAAELEGSHVMLYGADDYFYSMSVEDLRSCLLAYGMNGLELPQAHGYPVRLLVPNRWGKLHVKWITEIEVIDDYAGGYWEEQGWHGMGAVNAVTKIDRINRPNGRIQICGHAYAGDRGVDRVEVSTDGGETWEPAALSGQLDDPDTARQWVYEINDPQQDSYDVYARTIDGTGTVQTEVRTDPFPDGATGWIHRTIRRA